MRSQSDGHKAAPLRRTRSARRSGVATRIDQLLGQAAAADHLPV